MIGNNSWKPKSIDYNLIFLVLINFSNITDIDVGISKNVQQELKLRKWYVQQQKMPHAQYMEFTIIAMQYTKQ